MSNWKTILTFTYPHEAHLVKGYLESEGIPTVLRDEMTAQVNNFYSNAIGGVKIMVSENNFDKGVRVLQKGGYIPQAPDKEKEQEVVTIKKTENKNKCPFCESENTGKNKGLNIFSVGLYLIVGVLFPFFKVKHHCFDCGKEWKFRPFK